MSTFIVFHVCYADLNKIKVAPTWHTQQMNVGFCFKDVATICRGFVSAFFSLVDLLNLAELLHRIMTLKPNFIYPSAAKVAQMTIP
jgi:hypothetical protein